MCVCVYIYIQYICVYIYIYVCVCVRVCVYMYNVVSCHRQKYAGRLGGNEQSTSMRRNSATTLKSQRRTPKVGKRPSEASSSSDPVHVGLRWGGKRLVPSMPRYTHAPKSLQCLRLTAIPNQNARRDPCPGTDLAKPLFPLETLALTSLDQTIMVLFVFDRIPLERRFPTGLFSWIPLTPTNKNAKQALFLVCILQDDKGKKTRSKTRSKTRYGKNPASTHMDFGPQAANLPFLGSLVEMIIPALCRSTRKQQQQQLSNQQLQPNTT